MTDVPTLLIPGLLCSQRLYADQVPALRRFGPVTVASCHHDDSIVASAARILDSAPPRFALVGLSMGGYLAFEVMRQASERVARLALLNTAARPDTPEQVERRREHIAMTEDGRFAEVVGILGQRLVRPGVGDDGALSNVVRQMADEIGPDGFIRQQRTATSRPDSRAGLAAISCPVLVVAGADDDITTIGHATEIADGIPGARLTVIPDCGHLSTLEQPAMVTQTLVDWLSH